MSLVKHAFCLLALFAVLSEISGARADQSGPRQNDQDETQIDDAAVPYAEEDGSETDDLIYASRKYGWNGWIPCDWGIAPQLSCNDCNTRLICKPIGGILVNCEGYKPYCRNGYCSTIPSDECTIKEKEETVDETPEEVGNLGPVHREFSQGEVIDEVVDGGEVNEEDNKTNSVDEEPGSLQLERKLSEVAPVEEAVNEGIPVAEGDKGETVEEDIIETQATDEEVVEETGQ